jgi:hypothetical protein
MFKNMHNLQSDSLSHTEKCMLLACTSVFVVLKEAASRVIRVWWHLSHDKYLGGCEMGDL